MKIKQAKRKDIIKMNEINRKSMPENYNKLFWERIIKQNHSWVAIDDHSYVEDHVVGYILIGKDEETNNKLCLISFAVHPDYRKQGIGKELLKKLKKDEIYLQVRKSSKNAIRLYESFDFMITEEIPNYYSNPKENGYTMIRGFKES
jgi:[ribosomal protein S18]-alanine N-acetyltransferase